MTKKKRKDPVSEPELTVTLEEEEKVAAFKDTYAKADALCPTCGVPVPTHKCRLCGATKSINSASNNVIWMRNGRLVAAFKDAKDAYIKMALRYGIPQEEWPEKFR